MKTNTQKLFTAVLLATVLLGCEKRGSEKEIRLFHVSYDVSREILAKVNDAFIESYKEAHPEINLTIENSHAGSSKQAKALADGLEADIVSMNNILDMNFLAGIQIPDSQKTLISQDWKNQHPNNSSPWYTIGAIVVRKGNPKGVHNWTDLTKPGLHIVAPNLKTSGTGRHAYQSLWGEIISKNLGTESGVEALEKLIRNVPVFATGGRNATHLFAEQHQGDVLLTVEAEALTIAGKFPAEEFEVIIPPYSLEAPVYVTSVNRPDLEGESEKVIGSYIQFLYSEKGQKLAQENNFRPRSGNIDNALSVLSLESVFGDQLAFFKDHFGQDGIFDKITEKIISNRGAN